MENIINTNNNPNVSTFTTYEYLNVPAKRESEEIYSDCYKSFGWQYAGTGSDFVGFDKVNLKFKRDRKIKNRIELNNLQRKCESSIGSINSLEKKKASLAMTIAFIVGFAGTALLAGAVFLFLAEIYVPFVILGALGLAGWAIPYFLHNKVRANSITKINPLIDQQYDNIYKICEEANALLA